MRLPTVTVLLVVLALVSACSDGERDVTADADQSTDATNPAPGDGATTLPDDDDDQLVISVSVSGGLVLVGSDFSNLPTAVVYEDGTTFSPGAVVAIYPGPAVSPVVEGQISEEKVATLVEAAREAGLLDDEPEDFGDTLIADAGTTTITVVVDGQKHVTEVYALGGGLADAPDPSGTPGLSEAQAAARERVADFVDLVSRTVTASEIGFYAPERYRVLPLPPEAVAPPEASIEATERPWPFPELDLVVGECTAVTGERAEVFADALEQATEITRWLTDDGTAHALAVRAVLPHEPDCPEGT